LLLEGDRRGLLLLHGAGGGCTWDLKAFAATAHQRGYTVCLPALPGFGTRPEDLVEVTFNQWIAEAQKGLDHLGQQCRSVSVVGHSMGGVLSLLLAAADRRVARLVTWAAPWRLRNPLVGLAVWLLSRPGGALLLPRRIRVPVPQHLRDQGWVGYDRMPTRVGLPIHEGLRRLHVAIGQVRCPVLVVQGDRDEAVWARSARTIHGRVSSSERQLWIIEGGTHPLMQDPGKEELFERTLAFLRGGR